MIFDDEKEKERGRERQTTNHKKPILVRNSGSGSLEHKQCKSKADILFENNMDLLKQRLGEVGLEGDEDYDFVLDEEEDEKNGPWGSNHGRSDCDGSTSAIPVKTLIWEAEIIQENSSDREETPSMSLNSHIDVIHFATALHHDHRVEEDSLKQRLSENLPLLTRAPSNQKSAVMETSDPGTRRITKVVSLKLAETTKAEELAGYMSGTIPPFGHTTPLPLIIDRALETLATKKSGIDNTVVSTENNNQKILFSTGSGSFRHSLFITWKHLLRFAKVLGSGVCIAPITIIVSYPPPQPQPTDIPSARNTSDGDRLVDGMKDVNLNHANGETPYTVEPLSEEMQSLGRLLRDSSLREGKAKVIRTVISQAGDRFPQVS